MNESATTAPLIPSATPRNPRLRWAALLLVAAILLQVLSIADAVSWCTGAIAFIGMFGSPLVAVVSMVVTIVQQVRMPKGERQMLASSGLYVANALVVLFAIPASFASIMAVAAC